MNAFSLSALAFYRKALCCIAGTDADWALVKRNLLLHFTIGCNERGEGVIGIRVVIAYAAG